MTSSNLLIKQNVSLKTFNTFGIESKASLFIQVKNKQQFRQLLADESARGMEKLVLGQGSNVLFTQDYPGLVIQNAIKGIQLLSENDDHVCIQIGAGENWHEFVMYCIQHDLYGIENLSLIPGTVGAAPIQNIGAYGVELKDVFLQLEAINLADGAIRIFNHDDCQFGYRDSVFKNAYKNKYAILSVTLQLNKKPIFHIDYANIKETLADMKVTELSIKAISDAVIKIRRSKLPDPTQLGNAGSFFKNPIIQDSRFKELRLRFPNLPSFATEKQDAIKISAAWLIEQCGWKGKRFGNIGVYDKQALILVNYGNGSGAEIKELARNIQGSVREKFGVLLDPEVNFI